MRVDLLLLLILLLSVGITSSEAGKRRVTVPDDLDDVVDNEEDEAWRDWGKTKKAAERFDPPPDFSKMSPSEIQAEISRRQTGPAIGFVKLRPGLRLSRDKIPEIAMRWSKVLRTGSIEAKFMAVDLNTVMFTMERGQDFEELKEFVLSQTEAYEMKIGEQLYRRPGDPPLEELLHRKESGDEGLDPPMKAQDKKDEL